MGEAAGEVGTSAGSGTTTHGLKLDIAMADFGGGDVVRVPGWDPPDVPPN
jgi:hypothetical protein